MLLSAFLCVMSKATMKRLFRTIHEHNEEAFDLFVLQEGDELLSTTHPTSTQFPIHAAAQSGNMYVLHRLRYVNPLFKQISRSRSFSRSFQGHLM